MNGKILQYKIYKRLKKLLKEGSFEQKIKNHCITFILKNKKKSSHTFNLFIHSKGHIRTSRIGNTGKRLFQTLYYVIKLKITY